MTQNAVVDRAFAPIDFRIRFPVLDGIRGLAILMIFINHFGGGAHGGRVLQFLNALRQYGTMGVDLFFVLSGFLITGILYDTRNDSRFFQRFFARRSLRIFPVFYLVAVVVLLLTPVFQYHWRWQHLSFLLYLGNFFGNADFSLYDVLSPNHPTARLFIGHLWSLCVEEQFYLLWPFAVWWIRDRSRLIGVAIGISGIALLLRCGMCFYFPPAMAERWIPRTLPFRMDSLLIGATLALLLRGPAADHWQRACRWIFPISAVLTVAVFCLFPKYGSTGQLTVGLTLIATTCAGLIGVTLRTDSTASRLLSTKPLCVLGRYSYGFYIYHVLYGWSWIQFFVYMFHKTHSLAIGGLIALTTNFCVTFLVSKLSFDLFESRFLRYKVYFEYDAEVSGRKHAFLTQ